MAARDRLSRALSEAVSRAGSDALGSDYMSRAGPVSQAASLCRDDFQPGITWGESARLMADAMNRFWREVIFSERTLQECGE